MSERGATHRRPAQRMPSRGTSRGRSRGLSRGRSTGRRGDSNHSRPRDLSNDYDHSERGGRELDYGDSEGDRSAPGSRESSRDRGMQRGRSRATQSGSRIGHNIWRRNEDNLERDRKAGGNSSESESGRSQTGRAMPRPRPEAAGQKRRSTSDEQPPPGEDSADASNQSETARGHQLKGAGARSQVRSQTPQEREAELRDKLRAQRITPNSSPKSSKPQQQSDLLDIPKSSVSETARKDRMAPHVRERTVHKDGFASFFKGLKTSTYTDLPPNRNHPPGHIIRTLSWNALGNFIATGAGDRTLRVWNPERVSSRYSTELRGHGGAIERVEFCPNVEHELASCSVDGTVRLWDMRKKDAFSEVRVPGVKTIDLLAWKPNGEELVIGSTSRNELYTVSRHNLSPQTLTLPSDLPPLHSISFSNTIGDNPAFFASTTTGALEILRYPSFDRVYTALNPHTAPFHTLLSPQGSYVATGGDDARITLWDTTDFICARTLGKNPGSITSLSFSFDGSYIVCGSNETPGLEIAHVETGEYVHSIDTHGPSACVAWHPKRYALAYTGDSGLRIAGGVVNG